MTDEKSNTDLVKQQLIEARDKNIKDFAYDAMKVWIDNADRLFRGEPLAAQIKTDRSLVFNETGPWEYRLSLTPEKQQLNLVGEIQKNHNLTLSLNHALTLIINLGMNIIHDTFSSCEKSTLAACKVGFNLENFALLIEPKSALELQMEVGAYLKLVSDRYEQDNSPADLETINKLKQILSTEYTAEKVKEIDEKAETLRQELKNPQLMLFISVKKVKNAPNFSLPKIREQN
jgi:hypothetical protein